MSCKHRVNMVRKCMVTRRETSQKAEVPAKQETKLLANTKWSSWIMKRCLEGLGSRA